MAIVATGFFDGVHLGHRQVLDTLVSTARQKAEEAVVVTFSNHPRAVLQDDVRNLRLLSSPVEKTEMLYAAGVDKVVDLDFSLDFAAMTAEEYLREIIKNRLKASTVLLGYDNRLGSDKQQPEALKEIGESLGLEVIIAPPHNFKDELPISSTRIRKALSAGDVESATAMLGYEYTLSGVIVHGKQYGRTIGFPTANMQMYDPRKLIPAPGVYFTEVKAPDGKDYHGMTNVGSVVETHILDFNQGIYGLTLRLKFRRRLRDEKLFASGEELKTQLSKDEETCRALVSTLQHR